MPDAKYVTFKKEEWDAYVLALGKAPCPMPLDDAVVIRTKDPFAGPALHGYAATMALYVNLSHVNGEYSENLKRTMEYFHERAMEADATFEWKLPD
jgi:hypothetical protein